MRKLMAICLSVLMVLSMCSFSVMAEGAVDFSAIANGQPVNFVTGDLVLNGYTITSSNKLVIAEDGTVTRPLMEDAVVKVTIDGGEAIDVTVKAKKFEPLYVNDFSVDSTGWEIDTPADNTPSSVVDGKFNVIIGPTATARTNIGYRPAALVSDNVVGFQFDMSNITDITASGADIRISGNRYDAEGNVIGSFNTITAARCNTAKGFVGMSFGKGAASTSVSMKYAPTTGEFWFNGTASEDNLFTSTETNFKINEGYTTDDVAKVVITYITFCNAGGGCTVTFDMDNFVQYQEVAEEDVLANATDDEKLAYFVSEYASLLEEDYVANGSSLSALAGDLNFAADEELPEGVEIIWEADDADLISADGTVARPFFEEKATKITGVLKVNGEDAVEVTYDVNVLPLSMTSATEIIDAENLEIGSFVGADGWTTAIRDWERMEVKEDADGNKYFTICASSYQPSGTQPKYTFASNPVVGDGETLVFDAKVRIPVKGGLGNWGLLLNGKEIAEFIYYNNYLYDNDYDLGSDSYYGAGAARSDKLVTAGQWYNIRFEITEDAAAAKGWTVNCFIDGKNVGKHSTLNAVPEEITTTQFAFTGRSNMDSTKDAEVTTPVNFFDTDDVRVYTTKSVDSVINDLDDAGKVSFFKELAATTEFMDITAGQKLALDSAYASYDLDALGVTIEWASEDEDYIANDGTVKKLAPVGETVTVEMTATIVAGAETDTVTVSVELADGTTLIKAVNFDDLEGTLGSATVVDVDAEHGKAIYLKNESTGHKASGTITNISGAGRGDRVVFNADIKYVHGDVPNCYGGFSVKTYAGQNGIQICLNYKTNTVSLITTRGYVNGAANGFSVDKYKTVSYPMPESIIAKGEGAWVALSVDHNILSQTYSVYLDGELINPVPILQANMDIGSNGGSAIRGYSIELSLAGEMWVDNVSLYKYANLDAVEVNAALNAALVEYASAEYRNVLTNRSFATRTIGKSWINGTAYHRDLDATVTDNGDGTTKTTYSIKTSNPSTYKFVEDGPVLTYAIDGVEVDALNVDKAGLIDLTITAEANGITESFTVEDRQVAPVAIRGLALGTASCLNGLWLEGAAGTEKVIVVTYLGNKADWVQVFDLAELANAEGNKSYNPATGILKGTGVPHPSSFEDNPDTEEIEPDITEVKIFVIGNGIAPVTFRDGLLDW